MKGATENEGMELPNLLAFMKHLQNVTAGNMLDMERVRNGIRIRQPKKKRNIGLYRVKPALYGWRTDAPRTPAPPGHMPLGTNAPSDKRPLGQTPPRTSAPPHPDNFENGYTCVVV